MGYTVIEDTILYEDKDLLVCHKPAGMPVQSRQVGSQDMEHALLGYLQELRLQLIPSELQESLL